MRRINLFLVISLYCLHQVINISACVAQVYVNSNYSDSPSILEIKSSDKGLLIPILKNEAIKGAAKADGLLMYNDDNNYFNYIEDTTINVLNPWKTKAFYSTHLVISNTNTKLGIGTTNPSSTLEVNGSIKIKPFATEPAMAVEGTIIYKYGHLEIFINNEWKILPSINVSLQQQQ